MPPREPELQINYDENSIPVSAKCLWRTDAQDIPRIMNPIENVDGSRLNLAFMRRKITRQLHLINQVLAKSQFTKESLEVITD
jgi:hypothetical protein